ncbi:MAG TPA: hypothetical protein VFJ16_04010 [Longimicrobium sp.]|nr:hypothetical protein [Longimicrobium sp.]
MSKLAPVAESMNLPAAASLGPLPSPGTPGTMHIPVLALACGVMAFMLMAAFVRGYSAANPPETSDAIRRGHAKPVWTRAMWMQVLGAFALMGLMVAVSR